ncbi:MAG: L-glutamate gamma-semialdehyde dehydrogenase [Proteobacteria bacterium]|nr:MAG: L-glutamate gamma-semialdehyde dehydrogenase [Pseudomonadota bacterium]
MSDAMFKLPVPVNEPVKDYAPGDFARKELEAQLSTFRSQTMEIPLIIGGKEVFTGKTLNAVEPHRHGHVLAKVHQAGEKEAAMAVEASAKAKKEWENLGWQDRAAVFLKAAELLAGRYRSVLNAATMLNQSKTAHQAEIDAACELIDFLRFNASYLEKVYSEQPLSGPGVWNRVEYRPLEGFVFCVTPFNFTAIAANLPASAALMGNTAIWKPATTALFSGYWVMKILEEAGLPPGVINFLPGASGQIAPPLLKHRDLAGVHFTGSTNVFHDIWKTIGNNIGNYRSFPRIVGETGGKDFLFVHGDSDAKEVATALVRGSFEYQGQKCSASSRAYVAKSIWPAVEHDMLAQLAEIKMGDVTDFSHFVGAVIDEKSFDKLKGYIDRAKASSECKIVAGGGTDKTIGYFVQPTVIVTTNPKYETMTEELFGPVLTVYVYDDKHFEETLDLCDSTSPYALTGGFFCRDRRVIAHATKRLVNAAGNFYINDKCTGAVVGQQPFGGARASGTNDKAGSVLNLLRWTSARTIKETFAPARDYKYPFLR